MPTEAATEKRDSEELQWERTVLSHIVGEELETKKLQCIATYKNGRVNEAASFAFWLDDAPEWCEREQKRAAWDYASFLTIYFDASGNAGPSIPERLEFSDGDAWEKLEVFNATPEQECPFQDAEAREHAPRDESGACRYCGATKEEEHGVAYQGEHAEVLYRKIPRLTQVAISLESSDPEPDAIATALRKLADCIDGKSDASLDERRVHAGVSRMRLAHPVSGADMGEAEFEWDT